MLNPSCPITVRGLRERGSTTGAVMSYAETPAVDERKLRLRYAAKCRHCSGILAHGSYAFWDHTSKTARCLECLIPTQPMPPEAAVAVPEEPIDLGMAGAS